MRRKLRIVLDTNIIISAMFWSGFPSVIFKKCVSREVQLILSNEIIEEVEQVLREEKKFWMTSKEIFERKRLLYDIAKIVVPSIKLQVARHEEDNRILECAVASKADYIVSGNKHLLELRKYDKIKVVTARKIVKILEKATS